MATLRGLREVAGLTEYQLATKLLVPSERIAAWERGAQVPMRPQIGVLARALGVTPKELRAALPRPGPDKG